MLSIIAKQYIYHKYQELPCAGKVIYHCQVSGVFMSNQGDLSMQRFRGTHRFWSGSVSAKFQGPPCVGKGIYQCNVLGTPMGSQRDLSMQSFRDPHGQAKGSVEGFPWVGKKCRKTIFLSMGYQNWHPPPQIGISQDSQFSALLLMTLPPSSLLLPCNINWSLTNKITYEIWSPIFTMQFQYVIKDLSLLKLNGKCWQ